MDIERQGHLGPVGVASLTKCLAADKSPSTAPSNATYLYRVFLQDSTFLEYVVHDLLSSVFTPYPPPPSHTALCNAWHTIGTQ